MEWSLLCKILAPIVVGAVVIYVSFKLPPSFIKSERKTKKTAANVWEIIWAFVRTLSCSAFIAAFISYNAKEGSKEVYFITWFLVSAIPAIAGLWSFFEKDAKLNVTDRIVRQIQMDKEERETSASFDDRY